MSLLCPDFTPAGLHKACLVASFHCLGYNRVLSTALHPQTAFLGAKGVPWDCLTEQGSDILEPSIRPHVESRVFICLFPVTDPVPPTHTNTFKLGRFITLQFRPCDLEMTSLQGERIQTHPFPTGRAQDARMFLEKLPDLQTKEKEASSESRSFGAQNSSPQRRADRDVILTKHRCLPQPMCS